MFNFLICLIGSLRPLILLPGLYGSNLYATYNSFSKHWYCSKELKNEIFWVNLKYIVPPTYNCLFELLECNYNIETQKIESSPNVNVDVNDFGGSEGISYADKGIAGYHFFESFGPLIDYLKSKGYTIKKNLFGVPYDWRLAIAGLEKDFFPKLKSLIEKSFEINSQSSTIFGFSCGGFLLQRFLSNFVNEEWKNKYIYKVILLAPAFGGSAQSVNVAWNQYFPFLPFIKNDILKKAVENFPVIHALFPNHIIHGNEPIIIGPNQEKIISSQIPEFLIKNKKITGTAINMMNENVKISKELPKFFNLPTYIIYNSGIDTIQSIYFKDGYDKDPILNNQKGDGTLLEKTVKYICDQWNSNKYSIVCHDLKNSDDEFSHSELGNNIYIQELIYKISQDESNWNNIKGLTFKESPLIKIINSTYKNL